MASPPSAAGARFALLALTFLAALVLAYAAWLAMRSRRPSKRKPPRKTFEHGRRLARGRHVASTHAACEALKGAPVGALVDARASPWRADVVLRRRRSQPCAQAAGYLAGLFENAWAHEVIVTHPVCAGDRGGDCVYTVQRASAIAATKGGASTPGSGGAHHRSPQARAGGG